MLSTTREWEGDFATVGYTSDTTTARTHFDFATGRPRGQAADGTMGAQKRWMTRTHDGDATHWGRYFQFNAS